MRRSVPLAAALVLFAGRAFAYEPAGTPDDWPSPIMHPKAYGMLLSDRLEARYAGEQDGYLWDIQGWYGTDRDRWWLKTEGEGESGSSPDHAELQLLFGRAFAPFWDWQVGVRHDLRPRPDRTHLVLGLQGVAPYEFEIDSALFVSENGDVTARVEAEYDVRVTQRLVLQPRVELNASASEDHATHLDSGFNSTELGLRLRYEVRQEFAPYIGISWEQLYGGTADRARAEGEPTSVTSFVIGLRAWF